MFRRSLMPTKKILISGAGIAGLGLARQLKKLNIPFKIIEKRTHLSTDGAGIALPANAVKALRYMGLGSNIDQHAHQVNKIIYTDSTGIILSEASLLDEPLNTDRFVALHRHKFHDILRAGIDGAVHFGTTINQITRTENGVLVKFNNPDLSQEEFSAVIGADGINHLWIEAGRKCFNAFLKQNLLNQIILYVSSKKLGDDALSANIDIDSLGW